jgi:hypothetical protein
MEAHSVAEVMLFKLLIGRNPGGALLERTYFFPFTSVKSSSDRKGLSLEM